MRRLFGLAVEVYRALSGLATQALACHEWQIPPLSYMRSERIYRGMVARHGFSFVIDDDLSERNLLALVATAASGERILLYAEVELLNRAAVLRQFAIYGVNVAPRDLGPRFFRRMVDDAMEMSILSELKKRAGSRVQILAVPSARSSSGGEAARLVLTPVRSRRLGDAFEVARLLVRSGVSVRGAKRVIDGLWAGRTAYVEAPHVADYESLRRKAMAENVSVHRIRIDPVDVKALRARLGISQEDFAGRYGLDVATVRNWEQGRTKPELPAAVLLQLIDRDPEKVVELLAS